MSKIKLELIFRKLFGYTIFLIIILSYALLLGKFNETIPMIVAYTLTRHTFENELHYQKTSQCLRVSIIFFIIGISAILDINISLLQNLIIGVLINFIGYLITLLPEKNKKNSKRKIIIEILGKDNLDEESIEKHCVANGIPKLSETIYLFLNNTLEETSEILEIDITTVKRRINKFIKESKKD